MKEATMINQFLDDCKNAECINLVLLLQTADFEMSFLDIDKSGIRYTEQTNCINVGGLNDNYRLTFPVVELEESETDPEDILLTKAEWVLTTSGGLTVYFMLR